MLSILNFWPEVYLCTWIPGCVGFLLSVFLDISRYSYTCMYVYMYVWFFRRRFLSRFVSFCFHQSGRGYWIFWRKLECERRVAREERKVNYGRRKISGTCSCEKLVWSTIVLCFFFPRFLFFSFFSFKRIREFLISSFGKVAVDTR